MFSRCDRIRPLQAGRWCVVLLAVGALCGAQPEPFRFVAIGDSGAGSGAQGRVAAQMWDWLQHRPFQVVLMLGDNIYGGTEMSGGGSPRRFPKEFDRYYRRFQNHGVVFHAVIGNHDRQTAGGEYEIKDTKRFGIDGAEGYYTFSSPKRFDENGKPLIVFFALNSEIHGKEMADQIAWLKQALKNSQARWKVVYMHRPIYTPKGRHGPDLTLRKAIQRALEDNGVQLVLAGHNHFYARMKPIGHVEYLVSGGGGRHLYHGRSDACTSVVRSAFHFLAFEVHPDRIHLWAVDESGHVFDQATIDQDFLAQESSACPAE